MKNFLVSTFVVLLALSLSVGCLDTRTDAPTTPQEQGGAGFYEGIQQEREDRFLDELTNPDRRVTGNVPRGSNGIVRVQRIAENSDSIFVKITAEGLPSVNAWGTEVSWPDTMWTYNYCQIGFDGCDWPGGSALCSQNGSEPDQAPAFHINGLSDPPCDMTNQTLLWKLNLSTDGVCGDGWIHILDNILFWDENDEEITGITRVGYCGSVNGTCSGSFDDCP